LLEVLEIFLPALRLIGLLEVWIKKETIEKHFGRNFTEPGYAIKDGEENFRANCVRLTTQWIVSGQNQSFDS